MLARTLAQSLRTIASGCPLLSDAEKRDLHDAELMLERATEHVADMKQKCDALRRMFGEQHTDPHRIMDRVRLTAKASTYDEEARRLEQILEGK